MAALLLLSLNGINPDIFKASFMFYMLGFLLIGVSVALVFYMKDVINSKDFEVRRE